MKNILLLFLISTSLYGFIENLQYENTILRGARYEAALLEHNDKLYVDARGSIEEYNILPDGSLELNSYIDKLAYTLPNAVIIGDTLYVGNRWGTDPYNFELYIINISGNEMQLVDEHPIETQYGVYKFAGNNDYFIYVGSGETQAQVLNRETMEFVTTLETGGFFTIKDNLMYLEMWYGEINYLKIVDISEIDNPVDISSIEISENQQNITYFFKDSHLFIGQNDQIVIIDISDIENPILVSTITNIPSVPGVNFFCDVDVYENFLLFKNTETKLWIYDIADIENPQYVSLISDHISASTYKASLEIIEDKIYLSSTESNIMHFNAESLPTFEIIGEYGNNGYYHFFKFCDPYILFSDPCNDTFMYFNVYDQNPEITELYTSTYSHCFNDSLLCFIDFVSTNNYNLVICNYDEDDITIINTIALDYIAKSVSFVGDNLIITERDPGIVHIFALLDNYSLNELASYYVENRPFVPQKTNQCSDEYIYIISKNYENNISYLDIFENIAPFNHVSSNHLNLFGNSFASITRLSNERIILNGSGYQGSEYYLCNYTFPHNFEYIDIFNTIGNLKLHDDFLVWSEDFNVPTKFFTIQNDEFEELFSYDFGVEASDVFIIPETNILYTVGRYNILKYSFDYSNVSENELIKPEYALSNYPNPFKPSGAGRSPSTTISFNLTAEDAENAELVIYNIKGQKIKQYSIFNNQCSSAHKSSITWDGRNENNKPVSSGIYFYKLIVDGKVAASRKCLLLK